jgi:hypothetical protein
MIPPKTHPVWATLLKGKTQHQFKMAAASMLFFNLRSQCQKEPARFDALLEEARRFLIKYENVLGDDIQKLFG